MERKISAFHELRGGLSKNKIESEPIQKVAAAFGVVSSLAFVLCLVSERPKLGLWISLMGAAGFAGMMIYRAWQKQKKSEHKIDLASLRSHRVSRFLPWATAHHLGHHKSVHQLFEAVDRDLHLASHARTLGAHLMVGPKGSGKTHLAKILGKSLFGPDHIVEFDFKTLDREAFADQFIEMVDRVRRKPYQMLLLENIDHAEQPMLEPFLEILQTNQWKTKDHSESAYFTGCLIVATVTLPMKEADSVTDAKILTWLDQSGVVDHRFVSACSEVIAWGTLPYPLMAEIACRHLTEYWRSHSIELQYIAPGAVLEILKEVNLKKAMGLHPLEAVIRRRSARVLDQTLKFGMMSISLDCEHDGELVACYPNKNKAGRAA